MHWPFQRFNQILNFLIARSQTKIHRDRGDHKSLSGPRIAAGIQAEAEQVVHCALEGVAGAPHLLLHELGDIVVDRKGRSHILMLD